MEVTPFVHEGLGNSSYLVRLADDGAAVVDPDRSAGRYLQAAESRGLRITAVFETHLHADFVTGAIELAAAAGARVFTAKAGAVRYPHQGVCPGDHLRLDGAQVDAIASPGHTPEHLSYVLRAERRPPALFSGGALIVGGAARTDLLSPDLTERLTRDLFRTLRSAFASLPDETLLYPTHGGGSFCSAGSGSERTSTLGRERAANPVLSITDEEEFVRWFPMTFPGAPDYFFRLRAVNQAGPRRRRDITDPPPLSPADFEAASRRAVVLDTRPAAEYLAAHIPGSLSDPFRASFATWLGWLVPLGTPLLFVLPSTSAARGRGSLQMVLDESLLVGHENFAGWLADGIEAWRDAGLPLASTGISTPEQASRALLDGAAVLDVREPDEFAAGHIDGALHLPLGSLPKQLGRVPRDRPIVAYCGHGERSTTAVSLLERAGFAPLFNLKGGIAAWRKAGERVAV